MDTVRAIRFFEWMSPFRVMPNSNCISSALSGSDSNHLLDGCEKDFPVSNLSCFGGSFNDFDHLMDHFISNDQFNLDFGQKINLIFCPAIDLGMTSIHATSRATCGR